MRRGIIAICTAAVFAAMPGIASAHHIVTAALTWTPGAQGQFRANFIHLEKDSGLCCSGEPKLDFGDGTIGYLAGVPLNQNTPSGEYSGYLYNTLTKKWSSLYYRVGHMAPGDTEANFWHIYPAPGAYTVHWQDCCTGAPVLSQYAGTGDGTILDSIQPLFQAMWDAAVTPGVELTQAASPAGLSGGTVFVYVD